MAVDEKFFVFYDQIFSSGPIFDWDRDQKKFSGVVPGLKKYFFSGLGPGPRPRKGGPADA